MPARHAGGHRFKSCIAHSRKLLHTNGLGHTRPSDSGPEWGQIRVWCLKCVIGQEFTGRRRVIVADWDRMLVEPHPCDRDLAPRIRSCLYDRDTFRLLIYNGGLLLATRDQPASIVPPERRGLFRAENTFHSSYRSHEHRTKCNPDAEHFKASTPASQAHDIFGRLTLC